MRLITSLFETHSPTASHRKPAGTAALLLIFGVLSFSAFAQTAQPTQADSAAGRATTPTIGPETWLSKISDVFIKDVETGAVEAATLHHVQLQIAVLLLTDLKGSASGQRAQLLNEQLVALTNAKASEWIPNNPNATAPLLSEALLVQAAVTQRDWAGAKEHIGNLTQPLAKISSDATQAHSQKLLNTSSPSLANEPDPREYIRLLKTVEDALRTDDVLTAESYAPQLLRMTQQFFPENNPEAYSDGVFASYDALGRGAFARGQYDTARDYLLKAGKTPPGSSELKIDGPSMKLAAGLYDRGYSSDVIEFLNDSKVFWGSPLPDKWIAAIRDGKRPPFAMKD